MHRHPELSYNEHRTAELIEKKLKENADYVRTLVARNVFLSRDAEKAAAARAEAETKSEQEQ